MSDMKSKIKLWLLAMFRSMIQGAATAGVSWASVNGAQAAGADVPQLNAKALGLITLSGAVMSCYRYLSQNELPKDDSELPPTK
jgi:hypothetical protein